MEDIKLKIEEYLNFSLDFCNKCIIKYDEFFPFAFYIKSDKINVIEPSDLELIKEPNYLIEEFKHKGLELMQSNITTSYCIGYQDRIKLEGNHYDALAIYIKISLNDAVCNGRIYYYPFTRINQFSILFDLAYYVESNN